MPSRRFWGHDSSPFLRPLKEKSRVVHFGADLARFARTPRSEAAAAPWRARFPDKTLALFVGRLRHYKGIDVLIEAMRSVDDVHALIVGVGPMAAAWQAQAAAAGVLDRVSFLGELSDDEVLGVYHAADFFVLPSTNRAETLGIVQLEAMACGLPLVCTELGTGTSYVNQHGVTGFVIPPNDPATLAGALRRLAADPALRRQMGAASLRRATGEFSETAMIEQTLALYQEALTR